ncbi:MAG: coenzyme F420-0:L-glutamate ligase [Candidatus Aenigmarchaeota archaeon]|nr:coenzyme F420-0:L-glutamate ligase [Candidatus Aenigmarchaeota archaeon]
MKVSPVKTGKIVAGQDLYSLLDTCLETCEEKSLLAITSKIVALCEGRIASMDADKKALIQQEAEYYLPHEESRYNTTLAIKGNIIVPAAGVDESNGNGCYVLWPLDPQKSANEIRSYLRKRFFLKHAGVLITDSRTTPLRRGTTGVGIAHSGFSAIKNYIGRKDVFGRTMKITRANILDALAAAAVVVMGEGAEQTPLAVLEDIPLVAFQERNPTRKELQDLSISIEDDLYAPILKRAKWKKGGQYKKSFYSEANK